MCEGLGGGEVAFAEKFEGGAATGGDVRNLIRNAALMDGGDGVTATDNGGSASAGGSGDSLSYFERAFCKRGHFEYAHGAIPDDGFGGGNFLAIGFDGLGPDVEAHPTVGGCGNGDGLRCGVRLEFGTNNVIDREQQSEFLLLSFGAEPLGEIQFVVFNERLTDGLAFSF